MRTPALLIALASLIVAPVVMPTAAQAPPSASADVQLQLGDLVFFDASDDDKSRLDHVGMYLGTDTAGAHRFISSRKTPDGPTLADKGGESILNGAGHFARAFRAARRV